MNTLKTEIPFTMLPTGESSPSMLRFERILADVSARFINLPPEKVSEQILSAQQAIVLHLGLDRSTLAQVNAEGMLEVTHSWARPGFEAVSALFAEDLPWAVEKLQRGERICFRSLSELPPEATKDVASLKRIGQKSNLTFPLKANEEVFGALAFGSMRHEIAWPPELRERLSLVAEIFASALERMRSELKLKLALDEISALKARLEQENLYLREEREPQRGFEDIVGRSKVIRQVLRQVEQVAPTRATVLLLGETGTGKELLAEAIHSHSPRGHRLMVKVNCAGLAPTLIESELFGRERGAYTGALTAEPGRFELANGSSIFLDEIAELPLDLQSKLLRVLQEGEFERLGSTRTRKVDVRIIAATNRNLEESVRQRRFRGDLYYRLNVFPMRLPPLRERKEDLPAIVRSFAQSLAGRMGKNISSVSQESLKALAEYDWPGNIRELRNMVERALIVCDGPMLRISSPGPAATLDADESATKVLTMEEMERHHILRVLEEAGWRVSGPRGAAVLLGMKRTTLESRMAKLGIRRP